MSISHSGLRHAVQEAPPFPSFQWCDFKVSCSLSWKQQVLSATCVADMFGNDELSIFFF